MELKITLTSCLVYQDKTTNQDKTRVGYIVADTSFRQDSEKFKGFPDLSIFYDGTEVFNKLPVDWFGLPVVATIESKPNPRNPLRETKVIKTLKLGSNVINLV